MVGEALTALSRIITITQSIPTSMLWVETITMRKAGLREQLSFAYDYIEHDFLLAENERVDLVQAVLDFCS